MSVKVRIPTTLRPLTGGSSEVEVEGATVGEVLKALDAAHPGFADRILDDEGGLRRFVNVFVADDDVRYLDGLATPVPDGETVAIIPAVAVADDHFEGGPDERAIPERRSRAGLLLVALLVVAAAVAAFLLLGDDDDGDEVGTDATTTTGAGGDTTTTEAGGDTTVPAGLEQPALWPAADVVFDDPVAAAQDFLDQVLGAGEAGAFREGDARSGEVDALFRGEDGAQEIVRSTLLLRQLGGSGGWFVIAAVNPNAAVTVPDALAEVPAGPLEVEGIGRGFEGTLDVSARVAGDAGEPLDRQIAAGGAEATPLPFATTLDLSAAPAGATVTILVRGDTGLETDPGDFGAIPIVVTG